MLIPAMSDLGVAAAVLVLVSYAIITWVAPRRIEKKWPTILSGTVPFGILAGFIFVSEVLLEYILPADNTQMGYAEFGLVMFVYALVGALMANRYGSIGAGTVAAATTAIISSLIWLIAVLAAIGFAARYGRSWCSEPKAITRISPAAAWLILTHLRWKTSAVPASITCLSGHSSRRCWVLSPVFLCRHPEISADHELQRLSNCRPRPVIRITLPALPAMPSTNPLTCPERLRI
jgi:hypothetical protein